MGAMYIDESHGGPNHIEELKIDGATFFRPEVFEGNSYALREGIRDRLTVLQRIHNRFHRQPHEPQNCSRRNEREWQPATFSACQPGKEQKDKRDNDHATVVAQ